MKHRHIFSNSLLILVFSILASAARAENLDSLLNVLDTCILKRAYYDDIYAKKAKKLKIQAQQALTKETALEAWVALSKMEWFRHSDEALAAYEAAFPLAYQIKDYETAARMALGRTLVLGMSGLPWEGKELLEKCYSDPNLQPHLLANGYYTMLYELNDYYHAFNLPASVVNKNYDILKSLEDSVHNSEKNPAKLAMRLCYSSRSVNDMIKALKSYLPKTSDEGKGVVATTIANKYYLANDIPHRDYYWALGAIYNIRVARHENEALIRLAARMVEIGDWRRATLYTRAACEDAEIYNSRTRRLELYPTLTQVSEHYEHKNDTLLKIIYIGFGAMLLVILAFGWMWLVTKRRNRKIIVKNHMLEQKLEEARSVVSDNNDNATQFLQLALESVMKFEQMKKLVQMKLNAGETDRLKKMIKDPALLDNFKETCLRRFDVAFLRRYPAFIKDVNTLLRDDEHVIPSDTEFMNNELRILAFLRIGITDSAQIAAILGVSVTTVYCYRTKIRNRAKDRTDFERIIIGKD